MAKDVLEVLDAAWSDLHTTPTCRRPEVTAQLLDARSAIAELIAADVEYDEARKAWAAVDVRLWRDGGTRHGNPDLTRYHNAIIRRAAALAACRGL